MHQSAAADDPIAGRTTEEQTFIRKPHLANVYAARLMDLEAGSAFKRRLILRLIQRTVDALARKDFDALEVTLQTYDPGVELVIHDGEEIRESHSGRQGFRDYWAKLHDEWTDLHFLTKRMLDNGDCWALEMIMRGCDSSDEEVRLVFGCAYRFSPAGKLTRQDVFFGDEGWRLALEAAGLLE